MKKFNKHKPLFQNYYLTELVTIKKGKRKQVGANFSVFTIVTDLLEKYGIHSNGHTFPDNSDLEVRHFRIASSDFPVENIELFKQLYGYENLIVDIALPFENEGCDFSFNYNVENGHCELKKNVWGSVRFKLSYTSFADMWQEYKENNNSFEKIVEQYNDLLV